MYILKLVANLIRRVNSRKGKTQNIVFFDTNCYRKIAREIPNKVNMTMHKILICEAYHNKLGCANYLVLTEMLNHLTDDPTSTHYRECKLGLKAAYNHIEGDKERLLLSPDGQILQFFLHPDLPTTFDKRKEESIIDAINFLNNHKFSEKIIYQNHNEFRKTKQHINNLKQSWSQNTIENMIRRKDPAFRFTDRIAFINDEVKRETELNKLENEEASGVIFDQFAEGMCKYIQNNYGVSLYPYPEHIDKIKTRFKPIFFLQLRIIKKYYSDGYNHLNQRKLNDIIDYLICTALSPEAIFVTNETDNLKKFLKSAGIGNVMTLAEYLKMIGLERLAKKLALDKEVI